MPNTDPAGRTRGAWSNCVARPGRARRAVRGATRAAASPSGGPARSSPRTPSWSAAGVRLFTDDGNGRAGPAAHAPGDGVLAGPRHGARPALRGRPRSPRGAVMHEGRCCSELGLPGWPAVAEELMVHRDIELCPAHRRPDPPAAPVDGAAASSWCGRPRPTGLPVTAEAAPHHLSLTDEALRGYDPVFKVNPPLRTAADIAALMARAGRRHDRRHRHRPRPAPGRATRSGRSTRRRPGWSGWRRRSACACRCCTSGDAARRRSSARCRGARRRSPGCRDRHGAPIAAGEPANLTVFDPDGQLGGACRRRLASRSRNTPFVGRTLQGRVRHTVLGRRADRDRRGGNEMNEHTMRTR